MNKNPDNINRYLSSLRRFASLKEILQNHEENILIFAVAVAVDKKQKTQQLLLTKAQNCLRFAGSTISRYRPYRKLAYVSRGENVPSGEERGETDVFAG